MKKEVFTRAMLYELVWTSSLLSLSKKYAISDNGLRKMCKRMEIPLPANGHWQKVKFAKKLKRLNLPLNQVCEQSTTLELRPTDEAGVPIKNNPATSQRDIIKQQIKTNLSKAIIVPDRLTNPHPLVVAAKQELETHEDYQYKGMQSSRGETLDIRVGKSNIGRVLRFMDTMVKALYLRGYAIKFRNGETYVTKGEDEFKIQLREKMTRSVVKGIHYDSYEYQPTGILSFQESRYSNGWKDGKLKIEAHLTDILAEFELMSINAEARRTQNKIDEAIRKEKERIQKDFEDRRRQDLENFKGLLEKSERWHKANNLRNYIIKVEQKAISSNCITEDVKDWLQWAIKKADWYDPFIEQKDELLSEVSRETLSLKEKKHSLQMVNLKV